MKPLELPNFFPVHRFFEEAQGKTGFNDLMRPYLKRSAEGMLLNTHEIITAFGETTNVREKYGFKTNHLFFDSGGYLSLKDGAQVVKGDEGYNLSWNGMILQLKQIHTCQEINADIAVPLDFICHDRLTNGEKEFRQQATIENAKIALEMRKRKEMQIYASIQGWDSDSLAIAANELGRLPFDGYALGGMVPHANDPEFIARAIKVVRNHLPSEKPLHIFGITSPILMPILYAAGVTTVDSASYAISAANRQYLLPNFLKHVDLRRLQQLPCRCNICSDNSKEYLQGAGSKPIAFLAMHNLNIVFDHLKIIRCLKSLNKLEEYAAVVATASPEYTEAFKILIGKRPAVSYEDFNFNQFSLSDFEQ